MIKRFAMLAGVLAAATANAAPGDVTCMPMSEYQFQVTNDQVIAVSDSRAPHSVVMKDGRLFVENQWVTLSQADRQRVRAIETSLRALEPKIQAENARTGDEQFRALRELSNRNATGGDGNDPVRAWREQLQRDRAERRFRIGPMSAWQTKGGDRVMEGMADSMIGMMGDLLRGMQSARRSGNMDGMEKILSQLPVPNISQGISTQLCRDYQALNEQDNALAYRYNGEPIELLRVMEPNFR